MKRKLPVTYEDLQRAANILKNIAHHTPVLTSTYADEKVGAKLFFKCENFQRIGAFKFRGAYNAIAQLNESEKRKGVVAFSAGNHSQAVALASRMLNISATIVMPSDAPAVKIEATRGYGAKVVLYDRNKENREQIANQFVQEQGLTLIPPYDHPHVIAGQGTVAKELFEEVGPLDYLFVCVGGGGLISGCSIAAKYLSPNCKIIGVEPEAGNDAQQSFYKKEIVSIDVPHTIADGARTQQLGKIVWPIFISNVHHMLTVSDKQLSTQMRFFAERMKIIVEPTGCLGAAAVMNKIIDVSNFRVGVIVSGGNVDLDLFSKLI
jgi:threonine dehydratase